MSTPTPLPFQPLAVTVAEAARLLNVGQTSVWLMIRRGEIPVVRLGRRTLIRRSSLEALLDSHEQLNHGEPAVLPHMAARVQ